MDRAAAALEVKSDEKGVQARSLWWETKTAVGDKYVYENMRTNGHRIGGEQSGHIIFQKYATTGDGILTALKLTEEMIEQKSPLSKLAAPVKLYPQITKNVRVVDKSSTVNDPNVQKKVQAINEQLNGNGRILLRESGTEPVIRIMVEADNEELCNSYIDQVYQIVKKGGYVCE